MAAAHEEVKILNEGLLRGEIRQPGTVSVSCDEKPRIPGDGVVNARPAALPGQHACPMLDS